MHCKIECNSTSIAEQLIVFSVTKLYLIVIRGRKPYKTLQIEEGNVIKITCNSRFLNHNTIRVVVVTETRKLPFRHLVAQKLVLLGMFQNITIKCALKSMLLLSAYNRVSNNLTYILSLNWLCIHHQFNNIKLSFYTSNLKRNFPFCRFIRHSVEVVVQILADVPF